MDQLSRCASYNFLATMDLSLKFHLRLDQKRTSWVVICRGKNRFVDELHIPDPRHNLTSSELLSEQAIAKQDEPCSTQMKQSSIEETRADSVKTFSDSVLYERKCTCEKKRWKSILAYLSFKGRPLSTAISKLAMRLVRHYDQDERETDGAVHWSTICPKLLRAFGDQGARESSENDWIQHMYEGSNKTRFEYCENSKNS